MGFCNFVSHEYADFRMKLVHTIDDPLPLPVFAHCVLGGATYFCTYLKYTKIVTQHKRVDICVMAMGTSC